MAKIVILKHSVVISGKTFEECKAKYKELDAYVEKNLIFSDMTLLGDECIAVFRF